MPISINTKKINLTSGSNHLVLTPNQRTQQAVIAGFMADLREGDVVQSPQVLSFSQWCEQLWQQLSFSQTLPKIISQLALKNWIKNYIVAENKWHLTNPLGVAEKVLDAYKNLSLWDLQLSDIKQVDTQECKNFIHWITQLQSWLSGKNCIAGFTLIHYLIEHFQTIQSSLPQAITLVGFNELTPIEKVMLEKCQAIGCQIEHEFPARETQSIVRWQAHDTRQEIEMAAQKAKAIYDKSPDQSVAVVVHQLSEQIEGVHRYFSNHFHRQTFKPWVNKSKPAYNVSAATPLSSQPIIEAAINILSLKSHGVDLATLKFLKTSTYLNWGEQAFEIRKFLHQQSLSGYSFYSFKFLNSQIEQSEQAAKLKLLKQRIEWLQGLNLSQRTAKQWQTLWKLWLKKWGWLSEYSLDEFEQKAVSEFYDTLDVFLEMDLLLADPALTQAREYLLQVIQSQGFQLPGDRTNIHVLGVLEASGLEFDTLIMVGFNRNNWPQKLKLNPFLPIEFQQAHNMPHCSSDREYSMASDFSQSLLQSADQIFITQSKDNEDQDSPESAFFSTYPLVESDLSESADEPIAKLNHYQWRQDDTISIGKGNIRGGTYLIGQYADCPFKAIARHYLKIQSEEEPQKGIQSFVRGSWLHQAMELIWKTLIDQQQLKKINDTDLEDMVEEKLTEAQAKYQTQLQANAIDKVIALEFNKLKRQICQWLAIDKNRDDFSVLVEVEKQLTIGDLTFSMRVDRIDKNPQGEIEIIDYKTGSVDIKKWFGERPTEAQMPAYVLACSDETIASLTYAQIKTGEVQRIGLRFHTDKLPVVIEQKSGDGTESAKKTKVETLFNTDVSLFEQWTNHLTAIADNIVAGKMPVSPKDENLSCRYCDYSASCRIYETQPKDSLKDNKEAHNG